MKRLIALLFLILVSSVVTSAPTHALSLKMQPLLYNETLQKGEKKKGFIDISNPTGQKLSLMTYVQAFRQKDDSGGLEFYDDAQVKAGVLPDLSEFELGPREAVRMYFLIDGTKLPEGDIFGAIFVSTSPGQEKNGISQAVKIGTILTLVNGTPGSREADITGISAPFFQFGDTVNGAYTVKNTADPNKTTGFYPTVSVRLSPLGKDVSQRSPLVMSGVERQVAFSLDDSRLGFYKLSATYKSSDQSKIVFVMTGIWKLVVPVLFVLLLIGLILFGRRRRRAKRYYRASRPL